MRLTPGQKTPLSALNISTQLTVEVDYGLRDVDIVLFGLDKEKQIRDDRYTVLFSNPTTPDGSIRMRTGQMNTAFDINLAALPAAIDRLMIVASHDTQPLSQAKPLAVTIGAASFDAGSILGAERAVMLIELYRHNGEWRLSAIGQGFAAGLAKLIEHFGGDVTDAPAPQPPVVPSQPASSSSTPAAPAPATPPISLSKITLEKNKTVSLQKSGSSFGDIVLNLNWAQRQGGFLGGRRLDLDLGCLYELQNGQKGIVQALGHAYGNYDYEPYIELDGDDRSGANANGETIRINGRCFDQIKRIAVFALIYEGAVRWSQTDARISIRMPDQPEIVVEIRDGNDRQRLYGMAIIENINGAMCIKNHASNYGDQKMFADAIGIFLRWTAGSKD